MSGSLFSPPCTALSQAATALKSQGFAVLDSATVLQWLGPEAAALDELLPLWNGLPPDNHLKDGGHYRRRRHGSLVLSGGSVQTVPHRAHWQPLEYNALHGGMERWFEPLLPEFCTNKAWHAMLRSLGELTSQVKGEKPWFVEAHQFRIDTDGGIGRPTPEGAHRDGVDLVAVFLVSRQQIKGGETRVFEAEGPRGQRFTLTEPWSVLLLDDARVIHESTPIQPLVPGVLGWRDTLVVTLRAGAFQDEVPGSEGVAEVSVS
jgi:hypothetical protein